MAHHVFTYGSLMFAPVWQRVVAGSYRSAPATLDGHVRFALVDDTYPGMLARADHAVRGVLYFDVDAADLVALDHFEGDQYQRRPVEVQTDDGLAVSAETYVFDAVHRLSDRAWEPENFALEHFLDSYCRDKLG